MSTESAHHHEAYQKVDVETSSQGKLIVMLFNGAIKRAEEAKRQLDKSQTQGVHDNLIRAQSIIGELRGALDMNAGEVATNLDKLYEYFQHLLIKANVEKDADPITECVQLMGEIRDSWREVFDKVASEELSTQQVINTHGAAVLNVRG
jgi:flagellar protein FliS